MKVEKECRGLRRSTGNVEGVQGTEKEYMGSRSSTKKEK